MKGGISSIILIFVGPLLLALAAGFGAGYLLKGKTVQLSVEFTPQGTEETAIQKTDCDMNFVFPAGGEQIPIGQAQTIKWLMSEKAARSYDSFAIHLLDENDKMVGRVNDENLAKDSHRMSTDWDFKTLYASVQVGKTPTGEMIFESRPDPSAQLTPGKYKLRFSYGFKNPESETDCGPTGSFGSDYFYIVSPTSRLDETATWQTYRNEQYGFEFRYPLNLTLEELEERYGEIAIALYWSPPKVLVPPLVSISVLRYYLPPVSDISKIVFSDSTIINDINFKKDYIMLYTGMAGQETGYRITAQTKLNDRYYLFSLVQATSTRITEGEVLNEMRDGKSEYVRIFNQILSTFKFISPSPDN